MIENRHSDKLAYVDHGVEKLDYQPAGAYSLDIEIFSVSSLRKRFGHKQMQLPHQYDFGMLLFVSEGECTQWIDFIPVNCKVGSLLTLSPGQAHRFGGESHWDGWVMLFRPEFIPTSALTTPQAFSFSVKALTRAIPDHLRLDEKDQRIVADAIARMQEDSTLNALVSEVNALLHHQFFALLLRFSILFGRNAEDPEGHSSQMQRFRAFKEMVEENYTRWHQVIHYAETLGCSEKSVTRATLQVTGVTAKNIIASRINLEAKRLLVSSAMPVALVAETLGFDEPTNFVKFFKRHVHCTPGAFRKQQRGIQPE